MKEPSEFDTTPVEKLEQPAEGDIWKQLTKNDAIDVQEVIIKFDENHSKTLKNPTIHVVHCPGCYFRGYSMEVFRECDCTEDERRDYS